LAKEKKGPGSQHKGRKEFKVSKKPGQKLQEDDGETSRRLKKKSLCLVRKVGGRGWSCYLHPPNCLKRDGDEGHESGRGRKLLRSAWTVPLSTEKNRPLLDGAVENCRQLKIKGAREIDVRRRAPKSESALFGN